jgi:sulfopyruvate decarboxylase TPP-binding subunit
MNVASQIPLALVISHRGDLGEFNPAQVPMGQATGPILDALGIRYLKPSSVAELEAQGDGLIKLGYTRSLPVAIVLPSDFTGGKQG